MPSTVSALFASVAGFRGQGVVPWLDQIPSESAGVYIVSLSQDPHQNLSASATAPIDEGAVDAWIRCVQRLTLDGARPSAKGLAGRLSEFWLPDESVLYIGKATTLHSRVNAFYRTPLGARGPHAGGYWIKTLSVLSDAFVHFAELPDVWLAEQAEQTLLNAFVAAVSPAVRAKARDGARCFPFANLEHPPGTRKKHGILNAKLG